MMPVMPVAAPPFEAIPSLDVRGIAAEDVLEALAQFHQSLSAQLRGMDQKIVTLQEQMQRMHQKVLYDRRPSRSSVHSDPRPDSAAASWKLQAVTENVALEALRMDISSMLPVRATKHKGTNPKVSPKSPALQIPKKKEKDGRGSGQKSKEGKEEKKVRHGGPGPGPGVPKVQPADADPGSVDFENSEPEALDDVGDAELPGSVANTLPKVLPAEPPSDAPELPLGPVEESIQQKPSSRIEAAEIELPTSSSRHKSDSISIPQSSTSPRPSSPAPASPSQGPGPGPTGPTASPGRRISKMHSARSLRSGEMESKPKTSKTKTLSMSSRGASDAVNSGSGRENSKSLSRRNSIEMNRVVSKANLTEVFKLREMEITAELVGSASPKTRTKSKSKKSSDGANVAGSLVGSEKSEKKPINLPPEKVHIRSIESSEASSDSEVDCPLRPEVSEVSASELELEERESMWLKLSPLNTFITSYVSKALGLIPLFDPLCTDMEVASKGSKGWLVPCLKQVVSKIYHWIFIGMAVADWVYHVSLLGFCHLKSDDESCQGISPCLAVDLALLTGAILVLVSWGGILRYADTTKLVARSAQDLASYCKNAELDESWKTWSCKDALLTIVLWILLQLARFGPMFYKIYTSEDEDLAVGSWEGILPHRSMMVTHALVTGVLLLASFWQVRTSRAMLLMVNAWSAYLLTGEMTCMEAKKAWRGISGLFRKTSRTFEHCFASLAFLIVALALSALYDLLQGHDIPSVLGPAAVVFILPGVLLTHASTTTACNRLPSLVTLCEVADEDEDAQYMGLAMYLSLSECGFFVWDTCVTLAFVQKFLYFASALAGTIGFQTGAFSWSSR